MNRRGSQTRLSSALDGVIRRLDRKNAGAYTGARVLLAWERISGEGIARHTTGAHLRDGILVVYVDNHVWATEYSAMAEQFRAAVNTDLGEELVRGVRFVVSRKVVEEQHIRGAEREVERSYQEDDVPAVSLSEAELAQVRSSVAAIPDLELREAVLRATVKDLEWKKGLSAKKAAQTRRQSF